MSSPIQVHELQAEWCGDATSVVEFLRPLRYQLDSPGVFEVCVNRPGEIMVETVRGWRAVRAPELTLERCLSLATAVATYSDQQINQERPLLAATLPTGERIQFAIPPATTRGTVSITVRKPAEAIRRKLRRGSPAFNPLARKLCFPYAWQSLSAATCTAVALVRGRSEPLG